MSHHYAAHTQADALIDIAGRECWQHATLNSACVPLDKNKRVTHSDWMKTNSQPVCRPHSLLATPALSKYSITKTKDLTLATIQNNWGQRYSCNDPGFELRSARPDKWRSALHWEIEDVTICCLLKAIAQPMRRWQMRLNNGGMGRRGNRRNSEKPLAWVSIRLNLAWSRGDATNSASSLGLASSMFLARLHTPLKNMLHFQ
jgi:hypothetical protein